MKIIYLGIPSIIMIAFAFVYVDWAETARTLAEAERVAALAREKSEAEAKARYQEEMREKARRVVAEKARQRAEKEAQDRAEEAHWREVNESLGEAIARRETLTESVYDRSRALYLEQERHLRAKESLERQGESERFLNAFLPEARSNRQRLQTLLGKAESLSLARLAPETPDNR